MQKIDLLWDRLAGALMIYVENYMFCKSACGKGGLKLSPTYNVDYEIEEEIISELSRSHENGDLRNIWYNKIDACRNINDLPLYLKKLVEQFLPRFLSEYPQYKEEECLKIEE